MSNASRLSRLTKQSNLLATGVLLGGSILASGSAQADTLLVQTFELNEKTATNGSFKIDLNNDGFDDFLVFVKEDSSPGNNFSVISGLYKSTEVYPGPETRSVDAPYTTDPRAVGRVLVDGFFIDSPVLLEEAKPVRLGPTFVQRLKEGDSVNPWSGPFSESGLLYTEERLMHGGDVVNRLEEVSSEIGPFNQEGDRGFIGLSLTFGEEDLWLDDGLLKMTSEQVEKELVVIEDEIVVEPIGPVTHYGWIEVVRGSVTAIRTGFQTIAGAAAPIPTAAISEPATLPLIALGAAGLVALRRRKQAI